MPEGTHCDDVADDPRTPQFLRDFINHARTPAAAGPRPEVWATHEGVRVRLCMASRFGDVGINTTGASHGYTKRVSLAELCDFSPFKDSGPAIERTPRDYAMAVTCPSCKAEPGKSCVLRVGPHHARYVAAGVEAPKESA